jgi:hypothetical protein
LIEIFLLEAPSILTRTQNTSKMRIWLPLANFLLQLSVIWAICYSDRREESVAFSRARLRFLPTVGMTKNRF